MLRAWWEQFWTWLTSGTEPMEVLLERPAFRERVDAIVASIRDDERSDCIRQLERLATTYASGDDELLGIRRAIAVLHDPNWTPGAEMATPVAAV